MTKAPVGSDWGLFIFRSLVAPGAGPEEKGMSKASDEPPQQEAASAAFEQRLERYGEGVRRVARFLGILRGKRSGPRGNGSEILQLGDHLLRDIGFSRDQIEREG